MTYVFQLILTTFNQIKLKIVAKRVSENECLSGDRFEKECGDIFLDNSGKGNAGIFNLSGLNIAEKTGVKRFARVVTERHTISV